MDYSNIASIEKLVSVAKDNLSKGYTLGTPPSGETAFFINFTQDSEWVAVHTILNERTTSIYNPFVSNSLVAMNSLVSYLNDNKITPHDITY